MFLFGMPVVASLVVAFAVVGCDAGIPEDTTVIKSELVSGWGNCGTFPNNAMCVCNQEELQGSCTIFTNDIRFYMNLNTAPYQSWNDNFYSIVVGPGAKVKLCYDAGALGPCHTVYGNDTPSIGVHYEPNMGAPFWQPSEPWNGMSTVRVDNITDDCFNLQWGQAAIFDDINFNAGTGGDCAVLLPGGALQYPFPAYNPPAGANPSYSGGGFGLRNDAISSIKTGPSTTITLYANAFFSSPTLAFGPNSSIPDLRVYSFNDTTSSIIVTATSP